MQTSGLLYEVMSNPGVFDSAGPSVSPRCTLACTPRLFIRLAHVLRLVHMSTLVLRIAYEAISRSDGGWSYLATSREQCTTCRLPYMANPNVCSGTHTPPPALKPELVGDLHIASAKAFSGAHLSGEANRPLTHFDPLTYLRLGSQVKRH